VEVVGIKEEHILASDVEPMFLSCGRDAIVILACCNCLSCLSAALPFVARSHALARLNTVVYHASAVGRSKAVVLQWYFITDMIWVVVRCEGQRMVWHGIDPYTY
jgi:hypothetical protein